MSDDLLKDPLPEPWTFGVTKDGRVFFINDDEKITTWLHPETGQPVMTGYHHSPGRSTVNNNTTAVDMSHNSHQTTFRDPRTSSSNENQANESASIKKKKRRPSFTETLRRPLFRRSSVKEKRPSSARPSRRNSFGSYKGIKMTVARNPNVVTTRSGWLYKQDNSGVGGMKIWRKRWFVLSNFCLFYYKDGKEEEVLGSIVLPSYTVSTVNPDDKISRKYAFKIAHPGMRSYYICAESYNDMAQWVTELTRLCSFASSQKTGSRKSVESKENNKPTEEEEAFGFSQSRSHSKSSEKGSSISSPQSTPQSLKKEPRVIANGNNENAKISTSSTPSSGVQKQQNNVSRLPRSSSASNQTHTSSRSSSSAQPRRQNSVPPRKHPASQPTQRRSHRTPELSSDVWTPQNRLHQSSNHVSRTNSMMKLGNWVNSQKIKQQHYNTMNTNRKHGYHYDTASEMSSASSPTKRTDMYYHTGPRHGPHKAPSSGKRYKPGTYSDYMDSAEVASSIMSVPPMYRTKVVSLPRPLSSQDIDDGRNRRKKMNNSKSVGYLSPDQRNTTLQTNSEHNLSPNHYSLSSKSPLSADSATRGYDDVFSPISNNVQDHRRFKYEHATTNRTPSFHAAISPHIPTSTYEVKQVDVRGKQGQLRAFAISSRNPTSEQTHVAHQPASQAKDKAENNEDKIEHKLKRLNELDQALRQLSNEMQKLNQNKRLLEHTLNKAKSTYAVGAGSEVELEQKLTKVKSQLAKSTQKLKEMSKENEEFEKEIKKMKGKLLEQLNKKTESKSNQRQLEWELGRIQLIMEGVHKNKAGFADRMHRFDDASPESDLSPPNSSRSGGSSKRISGTMPRSPRDVKRQSADRHSTSSSPYARAPSSSSSVSQENKFFTLPGRGVSRATSVDSLTAASIARFTRPTSARSSSSLHRTKSAAERLLSGSHGNLGAVQDPDEIKKIQRELNLSRMRTLTGDNSRRNATPRSYMPASNPHMQVGIDVQMAIKNHRMPKVLQRAKREMQRAEAERKPLKRDYEIGFDIDRLEADAADQHDLTNDVTDGYASLAVTEVDVEPEDLQVDLNLTHQLIAPDKVEIPDRLIEYEDVELSPDQERQKQKKIRAIESMLSRSGQTASQPTVHLAAALAAEAGSVARAVAYQAQQNKEFHPSLV